MGEWVNRATPLQVFFTCSIQYFKGGRWKVEGSWVCGVLEFRSAGFFIDFHMDNDPRHLNAAARKWTAGYMILLSVFVICILLFAWISYQVFALKNEKIDNDLLSFVSSTLESARLTVFIKDVTFFGAALFLKIVYGFIILLFVLLKKYRRALQIFVTGAGSFLLSDLLKLAFHRARPLNSLIGPVEQFSFPSGHAIAAVVFYGLMAYLLSGTKFPRPAKIIGSFVLVAFSILIGFSRVYLHVHYPSDVLAGFCVGAAWLIFMVLVYDLRLKAARQVS
jgi:undecaprenyl-diphosphatase